MEPTADHAASRGTASRSRTIAIWTIQVPGEKTSPHEAANRPQPVDSPMSVAVATPSGGQPRRASTSRPVPVAWARSRGPARASRGSRTDPRARCSDSSDSDAPARGRGRASPGWRPGAAPASGRSSVRGSADGSRAVAPSRVVAESHVVDPVGVGPAGVRPRVRAADGPDVPTGGACAGRSSARSPSGGDASGEDGSAGASLPGSSSMIQRPAADRRARRWYSGPCLRGSAYSFGLIVQYVPLEAPYQVAPVQPGSNGSSSAASYEVEPGVARFEGRRRAPARRPAVGSPARPGLEPVPLALPPAPGAEGPALPSEPPAPDGPVVGSSLRGLPGRGRVPGGGRRRPSSVPDARARSGSAAHGSRAGAVPGRDPIRRPRWGPARISYAAWIARKRGSAASPAASGWFAFASRRYARRTSSSEAPGERPRVRQGSRLPVIRRRMQRRRGSRRRSRASTPETWTPARSTRRQTSSRRGASSKSGIASAPTRPCGSRSTGR